MEVNKKRLSEIFGVSVRTIQNWQEQGMPVVHCGVAIIPNPAPRSGTSRITTPPVEVLPAAPGKLKHIITGRRLDRETEEVSRYRAARV